MIIAGLRALQGCGPFAEEEFGPGDSVGLAPFQKPGFFRRDEIGVGLSEGGAHTSAHAAISRVIVQAMREYSGRGPTQASTTIGKNSVHCVLGDTLTQSERTLAEAGFEDDVLNSRRRLQDVMRPHLVIEIEKILDRKVIAFLSDNRIAPDIAIESFVLEPITQEPDALD